MPYLLGTDEAGYGPNLGPLVVAASAWEVPARVTPDGLYERLSAVISPQTPEADDPKVAMADSKALYKAGLGVRNLERGVLSALALTGKPVRKWREIWPAVVHAEGGLGQIDSLPWHDGFDVDLPMGAQVAEIATALQFLEEGLASAKVRLAAMNSAVLFPPEFNALVAKTGNKAEVLSLTTLHLVERMLQAIPEGNVLVTCDKHGGRDRYAALLQHVFADSLVVVRREGREESVYRLMQNQRQVEFRFLVRGERMLPTALASMLAKYLRELAMRPFNEFWQRHIPALKATAGYYEDAHRFYGEIAAVRTQLGYADEMLWRCR